ncbi:PKD domain-containing protein [Shewanella aestuarii]|uniref:PKD domain-containing protein n=1 Tax=Shewanella aestuarii TaxID=1028752 RepID=A0A6G9QIR5_9GAMM|nr:hypothetical protein [Shewanella aestuarii]QIR14396.1 hypothetical protein HBH39_07785 [Shewanella aestuarii]
MNKPSLAISYLFTICCLSACGGSDSSTDPELGTPISQCDNPVQWNTIETSDSLMFLVEKTYPVNTPASIIAKHTSQDSRALSYTWQQISGPTLALASVNSPVLSFTPTQAGTYQFQVNLAGNNTAIEQIVSIDTTTNNNQLGLAVNSDHQVVQGNGVSVRLERVNGQIATNIQWCSYANNLPAINLDLTNPERPLFIAPNVPEDSVVSLRASGQINGETLTDDVHILVTKENPISSTYFDEPVARTYAYNRDSPYRQYLPRCVYSNSLNNSCTINQLPLIGQQTSNPTIDDIMDRVVVSHDWMGERFKQFLQQKDPISDFITLLQSVTAIVISYDVRPSFYWVVTGAIYLDADNFWQTPAERDTINEAPDYRSDFGKDLQFLMPWRYVKNNDYAYDFYPYYERESRTIDDFTPRLASLLYHELAHANDFFPRSIHHQLQGPTLLDDYAKRSENNALISDKLSSIYPLQSSQMTSLATVSFKGETATATQKAYLPSDITHFFSQDHASDYYAYSSTREDAAMLFEEAFMSHRYDIFRDVAVTDNPDNETGSSIIVDWGQRGRVGSTDIRERAEYVIQQIMPEMNAGDLIAQLPAPIPMQAGLSWLDNLPLNQTMTNAAFNIQQAPSMKASSTRGIDRPIELSGASHK